MQGTVGLLMKNMCDYTLHQLEILILWFLFPACLETLHAIATVFSSCAECAVAFSVAVVYFSSAVSTRSSINSLTGFLNWDSGHCVSCFSMKNCFAYFVVLSSRSFKNNLIEWELKLHTNPGCSHRQTPWRSIFSTNERSADFCVVSTETFSEHRGKSDKSHFFAVCTTMLRDT